MLLYCMGGFGTVRCFSNLKGDGTVGVVAGDHYLHNAAAGSAAIGFHDKKCTFIDLDLYKVVCVVEFGKVTDCR